jgi:hypothetical protein
MRVDLQLSRAAKALTFVLGTLGILMALIGALVALEGFASDDFVSLTTGALSAVFFGVASKVAIHRLRRPAGTVDIRAEGLFLWCYTLGPTSGSLGGYGVWGFVPWSNVSAAGVAKAQFVACLGIRLANIDAFIQSRSQVAQADAVEIDRWSQQSSRIVGALTPLLSFGKFAELIMLVCGFTGLPKSNNEKDILDWNCDNYGWHILIPQVVIPTGAAALAKIIDERRVAAPKSAGVEERAADAGSGQAPPRTIESRLQELEELTRKNLITAEEYQRKREEILTEL